MKVLKHIGVVIVTLLVLAVVYWKALLLTVFSTTFEVWYAAHAVSAAILMLAVGIVLRFKVHKSFTIGASLVFSLCAVAILVLHVGKETEYPARMEISLPTWHFEIFTYAVSGFGVVPFIMLVTKWPQRMRHQSHEVEQTRS